MIKLAALTPTNLRQAKIAFLADPTHNPQFTYHAQIDTAELGWYGQPTKALAQLAQAIVDSKACLKSPPLIEHENGRLMTIPEVERAIFTYLEQYNLQQRYRITWSSHYMARTSIKANKIRLRLPPKFRVNKFPGTLHHEIGTHALRRINHEMQPWYGHREKFGLHSALETEEGLAVLHGSLGRPRKVACYSAQCYLAVWYAQQGSFLDVWQALTPYVQDPGIRFTLCTRAKRGLSDTSLPGGFTKDITYLKGSAAVWQWLSTHDFDIPRLYRGKIAYQDAFALDGISHDDQLLLPTFYTTDPANYAEQITAVATQNLFDQLDPADIA